MSSVIPAPEYRFDEGSAEIKTIDKVAEVSTYLVQYKDGQGKTQVRLAIRFPGSDTTFVLAQKIGNSPVLVPTHDWFNKVLVETLKKEGLEGPDTEDDAESI